jgi:hypothetical protein
LSSNDAIHLLRRRLKASGYETKPAEAGGAAYHDQTSLLLAGFFNASRWLRASGGAELDAYNAPSPGRFLFLAEGW